MIVLNVYVCMGSSTNTKTKSTFSTSFFILVSQLKLN